MGPDEQDKFDIEASAGMAAGQSAGAAATNYASASNAMMEMMDILGVIAKRYENTTTAHGHCFEFIEAAKLQADASIKRQSVSAQVSEMPTDPGLKPDPHAKADIQVTDSGKKVLEVQTKSSSNPHWLAEQIERQDYEGKQLVVPRDQIEEVRRIVRQHADNGRITPERLKEIEKNLKGETQYGDSSSGGTTFKESKEAARHPRVYAEKMNLKQVGKEFAVTVGEAAIAGAVIGGAFSTVNNLVQVYRDEKNLSEAVVDIGEDSLTAGGKAGLIGGTGVLIRTASERCLAAERFTKVASHTSKAYVATAVAAGMIEVGVSIYRYSKDEIDAKELASQIGEAAFSSAYSIYIGGLAAGLLHGVVAPAVATTAGFLVIQFVYQTCSATIHEAELAEDQANKLVAIILEACREMERRRADFDNALAQELEFRAESFEELFDAMADSMTNDDFYESIEALTCFAGRLGKTLKYERFQDFDDVMRSSRPLIL